MAHDVFISYSSHDKPTADAVCAALESRGIRCWIAPRDVLPGMAYAAALVAALRESRLMVLIFSSGSNQSQQVLREVERAASRNLAIIPLRIEDVIPSDEMEYYISSRHWLDALTTPLEQHLLRLCETVQQLLSRTPAAAPTQPREPTVQAVPPIPAPLGAPDGPPRASTPASVLSYSGPSQGQPPRPVAPEAGASSPTPAEDVSGPAKQGVVRRPKALLPFGIIAAIGLVAIVLFLAYPRHGPGGESEGRAHICPDCARNVHDGLLAGRPRVLSRRKTGAQGDDHPRLLDRTDGRHAGGIPAGDREQPEPFQRRQASSGDGELGRVAGLLSGSGDAAPDRGGVGVRGACGKYGEPIWRSRPDRLVLREQRRQDARSDAERTERVEIVRHAGERLAVDGGLVRKELPGRRPNGSARSGEWSGPDAARGSVDDDPAIVRASRRDGNDPAYRGVSIGFRCVGN